MVLFKIRQSDTVVRIIQTPRRNMMAIKEMRKKIRLSRMLRRPAKPFGLQGLMADDEVRTGGSAYSFGDEACVALAVAGVITLGHSWQEGKPAQRLQRLCDLMPSGLSGGALAARSLRTDMRPGGAMIGTLGGACR